MSASTEVVSLTPGSARAQLSGYFCNLTTKCEKLNTPERSHHSHGYVFPQVTRPKIREPCSRL